MRNPTKKELEIKIEELKKIIVEKDMELEQAYQKIYELQDAADKEFMGSPYCKQLKRELEVMTESSKSAKHLLVLSKQREEKLRERIAEIEGWFHQFHQPDRSDTN